MASCITSAVGLFFCLHLPEVYVSLQDHATRCSNTKMTKVGSPRTLELVRAVESSMPSQRIRSSVSTSNPTPRGRPPKNEVS